MHWCYNALDSFHIPEEEGLNSNKTLNMSFVIQTFNKKLSTFSKTFKKKKLVERHSLGNPMSLGPCVSHLNSRPPGAIFWTVLQRRNSFQALSLWWVLTSHDLPPAKGSKTSQLHDDHVTAGLRDDHVTPASRLSPTSSWRVVFRGAKMSDWWK